MNFLSEKENLIWKAASSSSWEILLIVRTTKSVYNTFPWQVQYFWVQILNWTIELIWSAQLDHFQICLHRKIVETLLTPKAFSADNDGL